MHPTNHLAFGGQGPILHLAPANGFPPETYRPFAEALTPHFRVIGHRPRPLRGTHPPASISSWHDLATDLSTDLDYLGNEPIIGVGHSLGGILSLYCAARQPERFRGLVLIDPVLLPHLLLPVLWLMRKRGLQHYFPLARGAARRRDRFASHDEARTRYTGRGAFANFVPAALEGYLEGGLRPAPDGGFELAWPRAWESHIFGLAPIDAWNALRHIHIPLLIIRGTESDLIIDRSWVELQHYAPHAHLAEVAGGHMVPMEQPEAVAEVIAAWARSV